MAKHNTDVYLGGLNDTKFQGLMQDHLTELISCFNKSFGSKQNLSIDSQIISPVALKSLNEMWKFKSFICPETELILNVLKRTDGLYEVRNIPILYEIKTNLTQDDEIVIVFDSLGVVQGILIALEREKYTQMFTDSFTLQDRKLRETILTFLESFRTAYNRKDLTFIEQVFSEDALIIVGHVLSSNQVLPDQINMPTLNLTDAKKIEYVKLSKEQYVDNLRSLFRKNRFVKVEFTDFKIQSHYSKPYFYGVQIRQKWHSASYSDDGYLFLLIDLRNENEPIIWVRTWQPSKYIKPADAFDLADFTLN
jgi:hypothetical protein